MNDDTARTLRDRALFDRIAATYCTKDLAPAQRAARRHRLRQTLAAIGAPRDAVCLEIGCGAGFSAVYLAGHFAHYHGLDHSAALIEYARAHNAGPGTVFEVGDVAAFSAPRRYDVIFMIGVLHHLSAPVEILRRLRAFLAPGGVVVVNEPQSANTLIRCARAWRRRVDAAYSADQEQYSERELRTMFAAAGYDQVEVVAQGLLSTPFAEVRTPLQAVSAPLSRFCCAVDALLERHCPHLLRRLSWNLIAAGRAATPEAVAPDRSETGRDPEPPP